MLLSGSCRTWRNPAHALWTPAERRQFPARPQRAGLPSTAFSPVLMARQGVVAMNFFPSAAQTSWMAFFPEAAASGTLPPGSTHCPAM